MQDNVSLGRICVNEQMSPEPKGPADPPENDAAFAPQGIWAGSSLNWSSPNVNTHLYVELPFWLIMPAGEFDTTYEETTLKIEVAHGCEEGQLGRYQLKNHPATVFVKRPGEEAPQSVVSRLNASEDGWLIGCHRTTLIIPTKVIQGVLDAARSTNSNMSTPRPT
jgi:hypothetical protein